MNSMTSTSFCPICLIPQNKTTDMVWRSRWAVRNEAMSVTIRGCLKAFY